MRGRTMCSSEYVFVAKNLWDIDAPMTQTFPKKPLGHRNTDDPEVFFAYGSSLTRELLRDDLMS